MERRDKMDVEASVRDFLRESVVVRQEDAEVSADQSLLDSGILDSASILELVSFLEGRFNFVISDEELLPENFETINAMVALVAAKGGRSAAGEAAS
jgi:acyl carrier protein